MELNSQADIERMLDLWAGEDQMTHEQALRAHLQEIINNQNRGQEDGVVADLGDVVVVRKGYWTKMRETLSRLYRSLQFWK
jgi:hypothetical protein